MISPERIVRRTTQVVARDLPGGAGLYHLETDAFYALNSTGLVIWELLEAEFSVGELISILRGMTESPPAEIEEEVGVFLDALQERQLIELVTPAG